MKARHGPSSLWWRRRTDMPYAAFDRALAAAAPVTTIGAPRAANGMTLTDLQAEVTSLLLGRTDIGEARRLLYINLAYTDLVTSLKIADMKASLTFSVTADQSLYLLPSAVFAIRSVAVLNPDLNPL